LKEEMTVTELYPEPQPQPTAVTIYTKPKCSQCDMTKMLFMRDGVEYTEVDITKDDAAYAYVTQTLGYLQAPVTVAWPEHYEDPVHWSGFRPDLHGEHLAATA
jgi:glutaredoxin-like protein NrdH